jgi:hypothetical protein
MSEPIDEHGKPVLGVVNWHPAMRELLAWFDAQPHAKQNECWSTIYYLNGALARLDRGEPFGPKLEAPRSS